MVEKRLYNIKETAEYLGLAIGTLYNLISQKRIEYVKLGRNVKFDKNKLDRMIELNTIKDMKISVE
ncbi:MAG: hypothetical protein A2452_12230 [Candidatus Firestonebacteria bacterium RIFOXYC2_FULL_39_67]|nr:MAG: hypothetical protein A2536_07760 [Candidatus Firestonebacteria bacterium RIFOXYD2_FULL_39_29]OGF55616.1 MAG: hypothetical protein A2452_12230 [Candidatus Firestonebacteria bacterium RIFOXYC2_FULL_39_67]